MSNSSDPALPGRPDPQAAADRSADFDSPWKEAIGAYFQPFLALFFPAVHDLIDWNQPYEFLDAELQQITGDADLGRRYADRLVKVYSVEGAEVWLLIHIEVQGRADEQFPARMFQYYSHPVGVVKFRLSEERTTPPPEGATPPYSRRGKSKVPCWGYPLLG